MKRIKLHLLFSFLLLISPLFTQNSFACSCSPLPSVYEAFDRSKAVFLGKIISTEDVKVEKFNERFYKVQVLENFKGIKEKEITISAGIIESSCFWDSYVVGMSYLIYAYNENNGVFNAGFACTRTTELKNAQDQIYFIRELLEGKPESKVYGSVDILENELQTNEMRERALSGIEVTVNSGKSTYKTTTDKNGAYRFNNLSPNIYKLQLNVPAKYKLYLPESETFVVTKDKKICRSRYSGTYESNDSNCLMQSNISNGIFMNFTVRWNNEIKGNILDGEGKIVENARMRLLPVNLANVEFTKDWRDDIKLEVQDYFVHGATPGQYVWAVEINSPSGINNKSRFFYPQSTSLENAKVFDVTETMQLKLDFKLPENIITRKVVGEILRENGGSVGGFISISLDSLEDVNNPSNKQFAEMNIDAQGRFKFNAFENEEYWFHVWMDDFEEINGEVKETKKLIKSEKIKIGKEGFIRKIIISLPPK